MIFEAYFLNILWGREEATMKNPNNNRKFDLKIFVLYSTNNIHE
jgi:hypothetical protein